MTLASEIAHSIEEPEPSSGVLPGFYERTRQKFPELDPDRAMKFCQEFSDFGELQRALQAMLATEQ